MTTPTGPDDERGQETCRCPEVLPGLERHPRLLWPDGPPCATPQQPPAQEREDDEFPCGWCGNTDEHGTHCPSWTPAPPSEADSAGEDGWDKAFRFGLAFFGRRLESGLLTRTDISDMLTNAYRLGQEHAAALAASSGVRGGDDQGLSSPTGCQCPQRDTQRDSSVHPNQARERLADVRAVVVEMGGKLYGPFDDDQAADRWASERIGSGSGSWTVRPIRPTETVRAAGGGR